MWSSMWYTSVLAILMADIRTGALQNKDVSAHQCYHCPNANTTCMQQKSSIKCPAEKPYCGTVAAGPRYISSLTCLMSPENQCSLEYTFKSTLELSCVCSEDNCNAPFSKKVQSQLLLFAKTNNNSSDLIGEFIKIFNIDNVTDVYKILTDESEHVKISTAYQPTSTPLTKLTDVPLANNHTNDVDVPHAEALKHEATVPPDDDEDESEGSGAYDDSKTPKNPASAPAVPSAYLPAEENKSSPGLKAPIALICLITCANL